MGITTVALNPAVDKVFFIGDFKPGKAYRGFEESTSAGGKPVNVARVATILGEWVYTIGIKAGYAGDFVEEELNKMGIQTNMVSVIGETRTTINIVDSKNETITDIAEAGPIVSAVDYERFLEEYDAQLRKNKGVFAFSGSLPIGVPVDCYRTLIRMAKSYGINTILDTSNDALVEGIKANPFVIKPNIKELSSIVGQQLQSIDEVIQACNGFIRKGIEIVICSMDKEGAVCVTKDCTLIARVPDFVSAVSSVGSGDAMVAGIGFGLSKGYCIEGILRQAMACGISNAEQRKSGVVSKQDVSKYYHKVVIERIL